LDDPYHYQMILPPKSCLVNFYLDLSRSQLVFQEHQ
jgi:hypothetical protein